MELNTSKIAILGGGNIGLSLAKGLVNSGKFSPPAVYITRRKPEALADLQKKGFQVGSDNIAAVTNSSIIILAVLPQQLNTLIDSIKDHIKESKHLIISVVSGVTVAEIKERFGKKINVVRAMPNTAISIGESMTCIASPEGKREHLDFVKGLFDTVGVTVEINENLMTSATALCACGIAFFLRAIRAASQGGIEIGFHAEDALKMAVQTAKGAAMLLLEKDTHPESEIDKVTSPKGCTIAGLNEMEHEGFSSALIKGITTSAQKAGGLYSK